MSGKYEWATASAPKGVQLTGVESFEGAAFATGRRGVLVERTEPGRWDGVFTSGATGDGRGVLDLSLTDDGERVWFSGVSGVFGYYDRRRGSVEAHPAPYDLTSDFLSVSANGEAGDESVHTVDGSGRVLRTTVDGDEPRVEGVSIPGDGTGFTEVVDHSGVLYAADTSGFLYRSENGRTWRKERLAETTVQALSRIGVGIAAIDDGGTTYKDVSLFGERGRTKKTTPNISSPQELEGRGDTIVAVGGGGCVLVIDEEGRASREPVGVGKSLHAAEVMADGTIIAAGSDGTILEGTPK
ncbi:hypothetical protein JCM30237_29240 [Halolamina litorea]|uniref:Uncharacterized protein n=1 Tax=Halolamina litorea TaxID=1515593 RepID=A0ABD6BTW8_9EURY|nr:hypothetical protein [Halolamina litorea]